MTPLRPLLFAFLVAWLAGCGVFRDRPPETRSGEPGAAPAVGAAGEGRQTERTATAAPGDRRLPPREDAGAGSPRRLASERLVEEGKGYWIAGRDGEAGERFQQAISLDGSNGPAWFYLAEIAADAGEWADAEGYRDRAAALLAGRLEYRERLDALARRIAERRLASP